MPAFWSFVKGLLRKQYRGARSLRARRRRTAPFTRLRFDELEVRLVPASYSWTGGANTLNWGDALNWSGGVVPGGGDDVTISKSGVGTITVGTGSFSVRTLNDTTAVLSIASGGSLSLAAVAATSTFGQNVTVQSGGTLTVGAGATVVVQTGQALTVSGAMTLASGDTLSLSSNYSGGTQVVVNGTLTATNTTFNQPGQGYATSLTVNSGGHLIASGSSFALTTVTLSSGSLFNAGDLSNDAFNQPLYLPITDVPLLSAAGGGADNQSFQDIDILSGTLGSGTVALNSIGTVSTASLRYVFPGNFTVASGATLSVGPNVPVLVQTGQALTVNGSMTLAAGDTLSLSSNYSGGTQVVVNGTLTATNTTFNQPGQGYFTSLTVNSGGHLVASGSTFSLSQVTLASGSVFNVGDLSNDAFNQPLYLPITDVPLLSAAGGGADNQSFQDIDILSGTLGSGTVALNSIGTVSTASLRYVFPGNFTVASGATLAVGPGVPVLVQTGQALTVNGSMTLAAGDTLSLSSNYSGGTQVVVNGTLTATNTTFNQPGQGYFTSLTVNSGGHLVASGSTFSLSQVTLSSGSVFNPGDLSNDAFNQPLYLPITDVPLLSAAGGGADNQSFQDIDILSGTLGSGTVALNSIGTVSTASLRYVFPGNFTVASGATLAVGPGVPVLVQTGQALTVNGSMTLAAGDTLSLSSNYSGGTQVVVNGTLTATNTTFNQPGQGYFTSLTVNSGGHLVASGSTFSLSQVTLSSGSVFNPGDLSNDAFNQPLYLPIADVPLLSAAGGGADNQSFQDIDIFAGTLIAGQALALNSIGTVSTASLRYVFPGGFTVASGATLSVGPGVPVLVQTGQALTVNGSMTLATGDTLSLSSNYSGGTQLVVNGTLTASNTTFNQPGQGYFTSLTVNSGGHLVATGSTFSSLNRVALSAGSTDTLQFDTFSAQLAINSEATLTINNNDLSNVPGSNNGIVATGSPTSTIDLTNNFWGSGATAAQIAAKIKDHVTDPTRPTVLYQPFQSTLPTQTTAAAAVAIFSTAAQNVTLNATVTSPGGAGVNQGTETFTVLSGNTTIGSPVTVNVTSGVASASYTLPAATASGSYTIQAVYNGTASFATSSDSSHLLTISAASATTAAANASTAFSAASQTVPLSATVTSPGGTVSEGTETFTILSGNIVLGSPVTGNVSGGAVSVNYTLPAATSGGTYTIQAVYNGTANFTTATDTSHTLTVNAGSTTTTAANTSVAYSIAGQSASLSATVTNATGTVNEGTVTFTLLTALRQGGFETPSVGGGSFQYNPTGSAWVFINGSGIAANGSGFTAGNPAAPEGTQVALLQGQSSFSQSLWLNAGTYNLGFEAAQRANVQSSSQTFAVLVDGTTVGTFKPTGTGYAAFTTPNFTVGAGAHDITFAGLNPNGGDNTAFVDAVQLNTVSGSPIIGSPVTANVTNGSAGATYTLPAELPADSYTIQAVYNGTASFATSTDTAHALTVGADVTGLWQGTLTQGSTVFNFSMSLVQAHGADTGTSTIQIQGQPQFFGTMNLTGSTTQSTLTFQENSIASQNPEPGFVWLLKSGILQVLGDESAMSGSWNSGGASGLVNLIRVYSTTVTAANASVTFNAAAQTVPLSATVTSPGVTVNAGSVTFTVLSGTTAVGSPVTVGVSAGAASVNYTLPAGTLPGSYTIQAAYSGAANFATSSDSSHSLTINATATTTTAANASVNYSVSGQTAYLFASVTNSSGTVGEGTLTFTLLNGNNIVGSPVTVNVVSGAASAAYALPGGTAAGSYTIQAVYNGTARFATSTDTSHTLTVKPAFTATGAANALAPFNPADQAVSLSAIVTSPGGTVGEGTETFTLLSGNTVVGSPVTVNVTGGAASVNYTLPGGTALGTYTVQAVYSGSGNFAGSSDTSHTLTVGTAATTTAAADASTDFSAVGQTVALSAAVTSSVITVNDGTVTFTVLSGNTVVGTPTAASVVNGSAAVNYALPAGLADGIYTIQAAYGGTADLAASADTSHVLLVGTILWVSPTGGNWDDPNNWFPHRLPQATDEVVIPEIGITVTKTGGSVSVLNLNSQAALSLSGASLTVTSGASQIAAGLTMTGGSALTAQGAGTTLTAAGTTDIDGGGVTATGGAQVALPGVTNWNDSAAGIAASLSALSGGVVSLPNLAAVSVTGSGSTANLVADGAGSLLDVPVLTTISGPSSLTATDQGAIVAPVLVSLDGTGVTLDGTGALPTAQIDTLTDGRLTVGGGSYDFSGLTHLDNSGVSVSGGVTVSLPGVTSDQAGGGTLQASGTGTVLSLPNLTVLTDTAGAGGSVAALSGGEVVLPELAAITVSPGSTFGVRADGAGSVVNLPALVGISGPSSLAATHQGTIVAPLLATLAGTALTLDGTGTLPTSQIVSLTGGQLDLGANYNFSGLTDIDGTSVLVSGGTSESLPGVTSYQPGTATLQASGAGSVLTLPKLTRLSETGNGTTLSVSALAGGEVSLPALTGLTVSGTNAAAQLLADGAGSSLNLPGLAAFNGGGGSSFVLNNGAGADVSATGFAVTGAEVSVGSGSTLTGQLTLDAGSILAGQGTVQGNIVNTAGTVEPDDPRRFFINGDYHQGPDGTLDLQIEGTVAGTEYDQIVISGTAFLDGTLSVTYLNGFLPNVGDTFQVMTYAAVVGDFATFNQFNQILTEDRSPTSLTLVADTIAVTTTADGGAGSLRQAITQANTRSNATLIYFQLPGGGVQTIAPLSALPVVSGQVIIDGTTQAGYAGTPVVRLDGSQSGGADGLVLTGGNSTVRGLAVGGFHNGIVLSGNGNDVVKNDYLGVDTDGATAFGNGADGLVVNGVGNNTVTGNLVGANGQDGIALQGGASGNLVQGNRVGTTAAGGALGDGGAGVRLADSSNNQIGGTAAGQGNTIADNAGAGIAVTGTSVGDALRGNVLSGNGGPGIDLGDNGRTANDSQGHTGPNNYLDFPVITGVTLGPTTVVQGRLQSVPSTTFILDFYASPVTEAGGGARAARYLGSAQVSTDSTGLGKFNDPFAAATSAGDFVTATATDPANDTSELSDPLQGATFNPPPGATITGPGGIAVGMPVAFAGQITDPPTGRTFTYLWTVTEDGDPSFQLPAGTVVNEPNFTFTPTAVGTYHLTLVVTDNLGAVGQASFALGVTPQAVTVAVTGGPPLATPFTTIALTGTVETAPGTTIVGAPAWSATLNGQPFPLPPGGTDSVGRPTLSFVVPGPGNYAVTLSAANNTGGTGGSTFTVLVGNGVEIVGLPAVSRSTSALHLSATVDDPNLVGPLTYAWSVKLNGNAFTSQSGADPTFSFTPDLPGTFAVTVTVTDADGRKVSASASTVVPDKLAILDLPPQAFTGQSVTLEATGFSPAPASSVHWAVFNAAGHVVGSGTGASFTYVPTDAGLDLITLTCPGQATSATLPIFVPGVTVSLSENSSPLQGSPLTLTADLNGTTGGPTYTYAWTLTDGTGQVVASGPGTVASPTRGTFTFTPFVPGPYAVKVTVVGSDGSFGAATSSFAVTDAPPTVTLGGLPAGSVPEGTFIHLAALANDPGGTSDVLRFAWTVTGPDGFSRTASSSTLDFVPVEVGNYPVSVTVTDSSGQSATASTTIAVTHVSPAAVISSGPATHIDPVAGVATIQVIANVPDPGNDGDNFQYTWLVTDDSRGGAVVAQQAAGATNSPSLTFSGPSADNYTLTLRVTDDDGGDATVVVPIRIGVSSSVALTNGNVPAGSAMVLGVAFEGTVIDASGLSVPFVGVALGRHDTLIGGAGPNVLQGDSGFNLLEGGTGSNTMLATGGDTMVGGAGNGTDLFALIPPPADAPAAPIVVQPGAARQSTLSFAQAAVGVSFNATLTGGQEQGLATGDSVELFGAVQQVIGSPGNDLLTAGNGSTLFGGGGNDTLVASGGSNIALVAGSQADLLAAEGSADTTLFGTSGSGAVAAPGTGTPVTLFGGGGQSLLISNNSNNVTLLGGSGNSTLSATGGTSVTLFGGSGNAMLTSSNANNVSMIGGSGNDSLSAIGGTSVTLFGGSGNATLTSSNANNVSLIGGSGNATLAAAGGTSVTLFGGSGNASLTSSNGNNVSMVGGTGNDTLAAIGGTSVTLFGGSGNATLTSSNGNNVSLIGGSGNDSLSAAGGTSVTLFGGSGNASLTSSNGNNVSLIGGTGNDSLSANGGTQVTLFGGTGNDLLQATGATQIVLAGGSGDTQLAVSDSTEVTLFGGSGNASLTSSNSDNVSMVGGTGNDNLTATGGTSVTLFGGSGNAMLTSTNANNATLIGGTGNATLVAAGGTSVTLFGGTGNDSLTSSNGSDLLLIGGTGNATLSATGGTSVTLFGGSGNASLTSSNGNNVSMVGGTGNDSLSSNGDTSITLFGGSGNASLTSTNGNNVTMIGGSGNDNLTANGGTSVTLFGGSGNAMLTSNNANNVSMVGGGGNDNLTANGGTSVTLFGGSGNDSLISSNGNNVSLLGGSGNATLAATGGTDVTLFGGTGNDSLTASNGSGLVMVGGSGNSQLNVSGSSFVTLFGGSGSNTLTSANSNNVSLVGGDGPATLAASGGTSVTLFGGGGSDLLTSSKNATLVMTGGAGGDTLTSANDSGAALTGGGLAGDRLAVTDGADVTVTGGGGNDTLAATGGSGISLSGLDGDNLFQLTGTSADPLDAALNDLGTFGSDVASNDGTSDGINTLAFPGVASGITLDLSNASLGTVPVAAQRQQVAPGLSLTLTGYFQNVVGTTGANRITGDPAANVLQGQGGNDTLIGGSGPATLVAGAGNGILIGGSGGTTYRFAGTGFGGITVEPASAASNDTLDFSQLGGAAAINLTTAAAQPVSPAAGLTLTVTQPLGITGVVDSAFADRITGNARDDVLTVQGGNDTFLGGGGNDTYNFGAASRGAKVLDETATTNNTLNFHDFDGPVSVNLTQSGPQTVSPGQLTLTLTPPTAFDAVIGSRFSDTVTGNDRGNTLIGGGGGDRITSGAGADYVQTGITQVVYLNFDAGSQPGDHVYTQDERDAIVARLEAIYRDFSYVFTQDPVQAAQLAQATGGQYATLSFNVGPYPGASRLLDTEHLDLGGTATINVNPALGSDAGLVPDTSVDVIGLTATIAAHELGHLSGLEHADAFGPIGSGIYAGVGASSFTPSFTGSLDAMDTPSDVMASPASVNSPLIDAAGPTQLGERDALHLAFNDSGKLLRAQDLTGLVQKVSGVPLVNSAVFLGELPKLAVPNSLIVSGTTGFGQTFQAAALGIDGTIAAPGQEDFYAISGHAGEVMSFEVASEDNTLNPNPFPPELIVLDASGKVVGYNVRNFEGADPMLYDLTLPADGTYYVGVDALGEVATGNYRLLMYSLTASAGGVPQGGGATVTGSGGNDTLLGSSANDVFVYLANAVGSVTVPATSGAKVLDLRRAPQVSYTQTGDLTLGSLTVLRGSGIDTSVQLGANPAAPAFGQPVTFTVTVVPDGGGGTPTGQVDLVDTTTGLDLGTVDLTNGSATLTTSALGSGPHVVAADYGGDDLFLPNSGTTTVQVSGSAAGTSVAVMSSAASNTSTYGQTVTFTADVSATGAGADLSALAGEVVTFEDGAAVLGTAVLNATGVATFTTSATQLDVGNHPVIAVYAGDGTFEGSSGTLAGGQTVTPAGTTTALTSSSPANTSTVGQAVTFTAVVSSNVSGAPAPTGPVTFYDGSAVLGRGTLDASGRATLTTSTLPSGQDQIRAVYDDATDPGVTLNPNFTSSSDSLVQTVNTGGPVDVTSQVQVSRSGLTANRRAGTFSGTIAITNVSNAAISGSLIFVWKNLAAGVSVHSVSVTIDGVSIPLTVQSDGQGNSEVVISSALLARLAVGETISLSVVYNDPTFVAVNFVPDLFSDPNR